MEDKISSPRANESQHTDKTFQPIASIPPIKTSDTPIGGDIQQLLFLKSALHEMTTARRLMDASNWLSIHSPLIAQLIVTLESLGGAR